MCVLSPPAMCGQDNLVLQRAERDSMLLLMDNKQVMNVDIISNYGTSLTQDSYVTELTEHIKVKSTKEKEEDVTSDYARFFPSFVWAVRDFTLELSIDGKDATADQYLENSLKLKNGKIGHLDLSLATFSHIFNAMEFKPTTRQLQAQFPYLMPHFFIMYGHRRENILSMRSVFPHVR